MQMAMLADAALEEIAVELENGQAADVTSLQSTITLLETLETTMEEEAMEHAHNISEAVVQGRGELLKSLGDLKTTLSTLMTEKEGGADASLYNN